MSDAKKKTQADMAEKLNDINSEELSDEQIEEVCGGALKSIQHRIQDSPVESLSLLNKTREKGYTGKTVVDEYNEENNIEKILVIHHVKETKL